MTESWAAQGLETALAATHDPRRVRRMPEAVYAPHEYVFVFETAEDRDRAAAFVAETRDALSRVKAVNHEFLIVDLDPDAYDQRHKCFNERCPICGAEQ